MAPGAAQARQRIIRFGEFELDLDRQTLSRRGIRLKLQKQPLQLLILLIQHAPQVVSRDEIRQHIWGENAYLDVEGSINFCIRQIRGILLDNAAEPRFIGTLPREGYRFIAPCEGVVQQEVLPSNDPPVPKEENSEPVISAPAHPTLKWPYWVLGATLLASAIVIALLQQKTRNSTGRALISELTPPPGTTFNLEGGSPVLSPNGHVVAFPASDAKGKIMLWVRSLDSFDAHALAGTSGAQYPFWSPDSRQIGYFAGGHLNSIDAAGSPPVVLADAPNAGGGSWGSDGTIFFVADSYQGISTVSASGGHPFLSNAVDPSRFRFCAVPQILPDGRHLLFRASGGDPASAGTYFASTDGKETKLLVNEESEALYVSGLLLYRRGETLLARSFDPQRGLLTGNPHVVAEGLAADPWLRVFDVSQAGLLIYQKLGVAKSQVKWFDRAGQELGAAGGEGDYYDLRLSPNSRKLAINVSDPAGSLYSDIWIDDLTRHVRTRLTSEPDIDHGVPVWSPDGTQVAFGLLEGKLPLGIYLRASDGSSKNELLLASGNTVDQIWPTSWSRDRQFILYTRGEIELSRADLWILPLAGDRQPRLLLPSSKPTYDGQFSPDGQWIAYASEESGRPEVYVIPFDPHDLVSNSKGAKVSAGKFLISSGGGRAPRWRRDGRELFYLTPANEVRTAELDRSTGKLSVLSTQTLFQTHIRLYSFAPFDVSANGDKFLINALSEPRTPFTLVQNWTARLANR